MAAVCSETLLSLGAVVNDFAPWLRLDSSFAVDLAFVADAVLDEVGVDEGSVLKRPEGIPAACFTDWGFCLAGDKTCT